MEKEIILNKIAYLKENIQKAKVRIEKYKKEKNIEEKETLELAVSKIIEKIVETAIKIDRNLKNSYSFGLKPKNSIEF